jgi:hypothetical protein
MFLAREVLRDNGDDLDGDLGVDGDSGRIGMVTERYGVIICPNC